MTETSEGAGEGLIIYQSKRKAWLRIAFTLVLFLVGLAAWIAPLRPADDQLGRFAHLITAYVATPVSFSLLIREILRMRSRRPLLVFDEQGITTPAGGVGLIRWSEIAQVARISLFPGTFLGIVPRDVKTLAARFPATQARILRFNHGRMGAAVAVSEQLLPLRVEDLLAKIGDYCARKIREHA